MGDVYIEKIIKRNPTGKTILYKFLIYFAAAIIIAFGLFFPYLRFLAAAVVVAAGWGAWRVAGMLNLEYEYTLTNGELDVDKIINRRSRKRVITINYKDISILAPVSDKYKDDFNSPSIKKTYNLTATDHSPDNWFIVFGSNGGKSDKLIFEPDKRFIDGFRQYIPRKVMIQ